LKHVRELFQPACVPQTGENRETQGGSETGRLFYFRGQTLGRFKVRHSEWRVPRHHWFRENPAWIVIAAVLVAFLLWLLWHKQSL